MLKLFKAKSLKSNTKQGTGVGAVVQGADSKNAKKQRGRSMVEMLGVLAIIGVLSIGGIQGYTLAMRKYRANEILNIVQKYAMVVYSSCQQAMQQNPDEYYVKKTDIYTGYLDTWICPLISFSDAGLGALPSDVKTLPYFWLGYDNNNVKFDDGGVSIVSLSSGDAVVVLVEFKSKEVCEAVMSITGKPVSHPSMGALGMKYGEDGNADFTCGEQSKSTYFSVSGYFLAITTMMN